MNTTVENIRIKKLLHETKTKIATGKEISSKHIKDDELLLLFQCADKVFKGGDFLKMKFMKGCLRKIINELC